MAFEKIGESDGRVVYMTYREALDWGIGTLRQAFIEEAQLDSWLLMEMVCGINRTFYYSHMEEPLAAEQRSEYEIAVRKRAERIPLQYITGEQEFMGLTFKVNSNVLIPRQDTETLVEEALRICQPGMKVLDLCTGSGCIAVSLMKNAPGMKVFGSDVSKQALLVAKENGKAHETDIEWIRSSLFENINEKFDLIVSNPPYIAQAEILELMPEVRDFEPVGALDGGEDGLDFYRLITAQSREYLNAGGYLYLEIGYDQGPAVANMMCAAGYREVTVVKDLTHQERVVKGRLSPVPGGENAKTD